MAKEQGVGQRGAVSGTRLEIKADTTPGPPMPG